MVDDPRVPNELWMIWDLDRKCIAGVNQICSEHEGPVAFPCFFNREAALKFVEFLIEGGELNPEPIRVI